MWGQKLVITTKFAAEATENPVTGQGFEPESRTRLCIALEELVCPGVSRARISYAVEKQWGRAIARARQRESLGIPEHSRRNRSRRARGGPEVMGRESVHDRSKT